MGEEQGKKVFSVFMRMDMTWSAGLVEEGEMGRRGKVEGIGMCICMCVNVLLLCDVVRPKAGRWWKGDEREVKKHLVALIRRQEEKEEKLKGTLVFKAVLFFFRRKDFVR